MRHDPAEVPWHIPIPPSRSRAQSTVLVWSIGFALVFLLGLQVFFVVGMGTFPRWFFLDVAASLAFALLVWRLRAATATAAALGGAICLKLLLKMRYGLPWTQTALPPLIALFVLTLFATRLARRRRADPEARHPRRASQIVANLGIAGLMAASIEPGILLGGLAALVEATADTVASETGKALAGRTISITTARRVPPGTDGGISLAGTLLGLVAAAFVAVIPVLTGAILPIAGAVIFVAGAAGLILDSLLGATFERLAWINNDLVNFFSTAFAAILAYEATRFLVPPLPFW